MFKLWPAIYYKRSLFLAQIADLKVWDGEGDQNNKPFQQIQ